MFQEGLSDPGVSRIGQVKPILVSLTQMTLSLATRLCLTLLALVAPSALVSAQSSHVEDKVTWSANPVALASLAARLREAAEQYRSHAPIPRVAMFDIAYPYDSAEAARMNGYALMIVTTVTQDSAELPLARVYLRTARSDGDAVLAAVVRSRIEKSDSVVRLVFGGNRADALYLVPLAVLANSEVGILVDFATRRREFRIGVIRGVDMPRDLATYGWSKNASPPSDDEVLRMLRREYPGAAESFFRGSAP